MMNRKWQESNDDQDNMNTIYNLVVGKVNKDVFIPVTIDDGDWENGFDKNYEEMSHGNDWILKFNMNVKNTSDVKWIEKVVKIVEVKVCGRRSAQPNAFQKPQPKNNVPIIHTMHGDLHKELGEKREETNFPISDGITDTRRKDAPSLASTEDGS